MVVTNGYHFEIKETAEGDVMFSKTAVKIAVAAAGIAIAGMTATPASADPQAVAFGQSAEIPGAAGAGAINSP